MHDFEMVVVGCGGGPSETDLSSYFVKSATASWEDGLLALEAGSGLGALRAILSRNPTLFDESPVAHQSNGWSSPVSASSVADGKSARSLGDTRYVNDLVQIETPAQKSERIYSLIRSFIITHAHLDHVSGLVLGAGSLGGPTRHIVALESTIQDLEGIFNGRVWPRLVARPGELAPDFFYRYKQVRPNEEYNRVAPNLSARVMPVSHGLCTHSCDGAYGSSAWFVRNDTSLSEFLFFGDVEPDSVSFNPRNRHVWRAAAPKIRQRKLKTIFLECSWRSSREVHELYGHMSPPYIVEELRNLATEVVLAHRPAAPRSILSTLFSMLPYFGQQRPTPALPREDLRGTLDGVTLVVIHCKASSETFLEGQTIADAITNEIKALLEPEELGISVVAARQGMKLEF